MWLGPLGSRCHSLGPAQLNNFLSAQVTELTGQQTAPLSCYLAGRELTLFKLCVSASERQLSLLRASISSTFFTEGPTKEAPQQSPIPNSSIFLPGSLLLCFTFGLGYKIKQKSSTRFYRNERWGVRLSLISHLPRLSEWTWCPRRTLGR